MRRSGFPVVAGVLVLAGLVHAQTPIEVVPCDLVRNPAKYDKHLIRVRGQVSIAFEDFSLATSGCGSGLRWVWLTYGGDEPTPTMSTVNDQQRKPGSLLKIHGQAVTLLHDESLEVFKRRLSARRIGAPGGGGCRDRDCYFYHVTATLTGIFLAAPGHRQGGYGHMGCCHLLVIQQVAAVDADRTAVPAGGTFACAVDTWNADAAGAELLTRRPCREYRDCEVAVGEQLAAAARHWNDSIDIGNGVVDMLTGAPTWHSPDLLERYSLRFEYEDEKHRSGPLKGATVTREICRALTPAYSSVTPIGCRNLFSDFTDHAVSTRPQQASNPDREKWRLADEQMASRFALQEAAKMWDVQLSPDLTFDECSKLMVVEGDQFAWCSWGDPASMQGFSIQISRLGSARHSRPWSDVPWTLTRGDGTVCAAEEK